MGQLQGMLGYQRESLMKMQQKAAKKTELDEKPLDCLSPTEQQLIYAMGYDPVNIDDLVERTGIAVGSVAAQMIGLEIMGYVQ